MAIQTKEEGPQEPTLVERVTALKIALEALAVGGQDVSCPGSRIYQDAKAIRNELLRLVLPKKEDAEPGELEIVPDPPGLDAWAVRSRDGIDLGSMRARRGDAERVLARETMRASDGMRIDQMAAVAAGATPEAIAESQAVIRAWIASMKLVRVKVLEVGDGEG